MDENVIEEKQKGGVGKLFSRISTILTIAFVLIVGGIILYFQFFQSPYPEIEGTYYLYRDGINKDVYFEIDSDWTCGDESGMVIYSTTTGTRLTLAYENGSSFFLTGNVKDGVAFLSDKDGNYYCYCQEGKTPPTDDQELSFNSDIWHNFTVTEYDDFASYAVTGIGTYFQTKIEIPEQRNDKIVNTIADGAFAGLDWITEVSIPESIVYIGEGAFSGCSSLLKTVDGVIYVDNWVVGVSPDCKNAKIRKGTVGIAEGAFKNATALTSVTMEEDVLYIGEGAFYGCKNLSSITLSSTLFAIGAQAFTNCTALESIEIPSSVRFIGAYAFLGNSALTANVHGSTDSFVETWNERD